MLSNLVLAVLIIGPAILALWYVTVTAPERERQREMRSFEHRYVDRPYDWEEEGSLD